MIGFVKQVVELGMKGGALAGLILPFLSLPVAVMLQFVSTRVAGGDFLQAIPMLIVAVFLTFPLATLVGIALGLVIGVVTFIFFSVPGESHSDLLFTSVGIIWATISSYVTVLTINTVLKLWSVGSPDMFNQFSTSGAILAFAITFHASRNFKKILSDSTKK